MAEERFKVLRNTFQTSHECHENAMFTTYIFQGMLFDDKIKLMQRKKYRHYGSTYFTGRRNIVI